MTIFISKCIWLIIHAFSFRDPMFKKTSIDISCPEDQLMKTETARRKSMNVLSYLDWFVYGSSEKMQTLRNFMVEAEDKEAGGAQFDSQDLTQITDSAQNSVELLFSAGTAIDHMSSVVADLVSFIVTLRSK